MTFVTPKSARCVLLETNKTVEMYEDHPHHFQVFTQGKEYNGDYPNKLKTLPFLFANLSRPITSIYELHTQIWKYYS